MKFQIKNNIPCITSGIFDFYGVPHAFTTARGGCSEGDFDSLNVSTRRCDREGKCDLYENTVENFSRALSTVGACPENSVCAHQVHGSTVLELDESFCGMGILKSAKINLDGDGLFAAKGCGIAAICVKSADCTPVLFADKAKGNVCAVHSGWRGTVLDIVGKAVEVMVRNGSKKEDILCTVGPCIGVCCYEVSEDVYLEAERTLKAKNAPDLISDIFINKRNTEKGTKYDFNIGKMCTELAVLSGIPRENTEFLDICTCCAKDENGSIFFSHRGQGGHSGTFASVIAPFSANRINK